MITRHSIGVCMICLALAITLAWVLPSLAQDTNDETSAAEPTELVPDEAFAAPVVVDGETLFLIRGTTALPANERAARVEERIVEIAESSENVRVTTTVQKGEFGFDIQVDGLTVAVTTAADAELEQLDIEVLADLHAQAIDAAIETYRAERTTDARVDSALAAVAWTAMFLLLSILFFRGRNKVALAAADFTEARFTKVEEATGNIVRGKAVASLVRFVVQVLLWIIYLVLLYYYLSFVLLGFAETRPFAELLLTYVSKPLIGIVVGFVDYLPNLITLIIIAIITRYCIKALRLFFENIEAGNFQLREFEPHWISPTFHISRVVIILIAVVFAYPFIPGSDSAVFQGLTILAGVMVSLGSNTVVSNMMAGLFVIYRRSTNIGDRIKVGEQIGDVVEIKLMETLIRSVKNEMISIPNSQLLNSEVVNYSRRIDGKGLLVHTTVGIGYEEPQEKVEAMLIEAARRTDGVKKSPVPFVLWTGLGDYAINYQVNAFTNRGGSLPQILSNLHRNIISVFNENDVQIMTPSYEADPEEPKIPTKAWDGSLARTE